MANKFQELSIVAKRLNKMPVNYKSFAGREFVTYYTTHEFLSKIVLSMGIDNSIEKEYRNVTGGLEELGFKQIALFINKFTGESIAILGI